MVERERTFGAKWRNVGDLDYARLDGNGLTSRVTYLAIPESHPLCGTHYLDFDGPGVNGGITFSGDNVFGWFNPHDYDRRSHQARARV